MKNKKVVSFIFARPDSGRLPKKHERLIGNKKLLEWCISNAKPFSDEVVILTTKAGEKAYDGFKTTVCAPIEDDSNTMLRLKEACRLYPADYYAVISGDCPILDAPYIKDMINFLSDNKGFDYSHGNPNGIRLGVDIMAASATEKLPDYGTDLSLGLVEGFRGIQLNNFFDNLIKMRLTVDNLADLAFFNEVYRLLALENMPLTFNNMYQLVSGRPDIAKLNAHVNQRKTTETYDKIIIVTYGGDEWGMGHIARSIALYQMYSEEFSQPTRIYVNKNDNAIDFLKRNQLIQNLDFFTYESSPALLDEDIVNCKMVFDRPNHSSLNYKEIFMEDPTFATDYRLNYVKSIPIPYNDIGTFGLGDNKKYLTKLPKTVRILDDTEDLYDELSKAERVYTMFSQTAREALKLGKDVYCYTNNSVDSEICRYLESKTILTWMGNLEKGI